jgi:hypothetical protein
MICDWIGHKFRARYDTQLPPGIAVDRYLALNMGIDVFKNKTYRRDICERCGKVIELEKKQ